MVILFIVLGLGFLGGGIALIVEGWPYMILERGFTQVIAGTVLASAGVVLLALSRLMSELKALRSTLSNAVMAASLASMATREEPVLAEAFALEPAQRRDLGMESLSGPAVGMLAGAAAGALAGAAVGRGEASGHDAAAQGATTEEERINERDLFGVVTSPADEPEPVLEMPVSEAKVEDDAARLPFDDETWLDRELTRSFAGQGDVAPPVAAPKVELPETIKAEAATLNDDAFGQDLERVLSVSSPARDVRPQDTGPDVLPASDPDPVEPAKSEFDFLRERLSHLRVEPEETSTSRPLADGEIHDAAAWMAPWLGGPAKEAQPASPGDETRSPDADADDGLNGLQPPTWPPQTHSAASESDVPVGEVPLVEPARPDDRFHETAATDFARMDAREPDTDLPDPAPAAVEEEPVAAAEPAASDEGVIGAYQVGDAHFTIFSDGSIQARTPDGDYRFGSMDELKTYLASEKSRLGV